MRYRKNFCACTAYVTINILEPASEFLFAGFKPGAPVGLTDYRHQLTPDTGELLSVRWEFLLPSMSWRGHEVLTSL